MLQGKFLLFVGLKGGNVESDRGAVRSLHLDGLRTGGRESEVGDADILLAIALIGGTGGDDGRAVVHIG